MERRRIPPLVRWTNYLLLALFGAMWAWKYWLGPVPFLLVAIFVAIGMIWMLLLAMWQVRLRVEREHEKRRLNRRAKLAARDSGRPTASQNSGETGTAT